MTSRLNLSFFAVAQQLPDVRFKVLVGGVIQPARCEPLDTVNQLIAIKI